MGGERAQELALALCNQGRPPTLSQIARLVSEMKELDDKEIGDLVDSVLPRCAKYPIALVLALYKVSQDRPGVLDELKRRSRWTGNCAVLMRAYRQLTDLIARAKSDASFALKIANNLGIWSAPRSDQLRPLFVKAYSRCTAGNPLIDVLLTLLRLIEEGVFGLID